MTDVYISQPIQSSVLDQQAEQAAYERGRMQGEMEAIRRIEAEAPLKQMAPTQQDFALQQQRATLERPDVIEINRLTWAQWIAAAGGEICAVTFVILTIIHLDMYEGGFSWANNGDETGNIEHFNTGLLCFALGLFCHGQAITNYRMLPLNLNGSFGRVWYTLMQAFTLVGYTLGLTAIIQSTPASNESIGADPLVVPESEATFWTTAHWCMALALIVWFTHWCYSLVRVSFSAAMPVSYETWAETDSHLEEEAQLRNNEGRKDLAYDSKFRTLYTPAPVHMPRTAAHVPAANANVGAQVPVAPANAPRWAENPNAHAEDFFLLPRARWATVGFLACGAAFLMMISMQQTLNAVGARNWAQASLDGRPRLGQTSNEAELTGALGLITMMAVFMLAYVAMPPRTTLCKNGVLVEPRRSSISHNAPTQLHQQQQHDNNVV